MSTVLTEKPIKEKLIYTQRKDLWWVEPLFFGLILLLFILYSLWATFQGEYYTYGPYLSPLYSPHIAVKWWKFSPAFLLVWIPIGYRATCYYFRKVYYRSYFMDPPACAVGEPCRSYCGENSFPFILQNIHRYFLYGALILIIFHWYDVIHAFIFNGRFGIGVGSLIMLADTFLLSLYILSCHSLRHLIGGFLDSFKCLHQYNFYKFVSCENSRHMLWAWTSLFMVGFADLYIRLCAMGVWMDMRLI